MVLLPLAVAGPHSLLALGGFGLTYIKNKHFQKQQLPGNVTKVTRVIETNKIARIFAGIFTLGLTELMNHKEVSVEFFFEDEFIGCNEEDAAEELYEKGNKFYKNGNYEAAETLFARASNLAEASGTINWKYKESLKRVRQKIKEVAERREREEFARREREEEAEKIKREEAEKIKREEAEREAKEEALRLERARTESKSLLKEATNIYKQAEALSSVELKLEKYEIALCKCEESCASGATEEAFNTVNKIFESCLNYDAHDEAEDAVQIVRKYFPSEAGRLQDALVNQQNISWSPDYESKQQEQEQNRTVMMMLA